MPREEFGFTLSVLGKFVDHPATGQKVIQAQVQDFFASEEARRAALVVLEKYLAQQVEKSTGIILPGG